MKNLVQITGWGKYPLSHSQVRAINWRTDPLPQTEQHVFMLPYGQGRSYGDSCLNNENIIVKTSNLNKFINFDRSSGLLSCESGVTLAEILDVIVPQGWFLPVTPGTKFVSIGGAIANDVHGKNHHVAGNFGHFVKRFELLRSDGRFICSPEQNPDFFYSTIGGLGLTGIITWAEIQLKPIHNPFIAQEVIRFKNIDEFFTLSAESEKLFEYTVAWIDCLAHGQSVGRGHFIRGNHAAVQDQAGIKVPLKLKVPCYAPNQSLNRLTLSAFNNAYYWRQINKIKTNVSYYEPFFYPLDSIHQWNYIYGKRGFLQYQCVVPQHNGGQIMKSILDLIAKAHTGSFLAVLKMFGNIPSLGMLSFPRPGITLALDFPFTGKPILELLEKCDALVKEVGGCVYPAKDARMSAESFAQFFPNFNEFQKFIDPKFSSSFIRRVKKL